MKLRASGFVVPIIRTVSLSALAAVLTLTAPAAPLGTAFTYQGVLKDGGTPADGAYNFVFRLFDDELAGSQVGSDVTLNGVTVTDGLFTVELDFGAVFDGSELWLEIEVDSTVLGARQNLTPTPYALFAATSNLDVFATIDAPAGTDPAADEPADTLSLAAGGIVTITGDAATDTVTISAIEVDGSTSNELQNLFATVAGDAGSTTADALADTLSVVGAGTVSTAVAGDTLTITGAAGAGNTLDQAYDAGGAGAGRTITVDSGPVTLDGGSLRQTPGDPALAGSLAIGDSPQSVSVASRYAYVVDSTSDDLKVIDVSDPSAPSLAGSLGLGTAPQSVFVSGRYAYVVDSGSDDLKVIDVSDPSAPAVAGSLGIGGSPQGVFVSGRYAYVVDLVSDDLKVIDVSDPNAPSLAGTLALGNFPRSVFVSGRYAYVVDTGSDDLKVIDVSDPGAPSLAGVLGIGPGPVQVFVSGRYAYVVDINSDDLKVIDVSDPNAPSLAGSLGIGARPESVFVSGRYAYVVDATSVDLKVIDVSDPTAPSLAGSLAIGDFPQSVFVAGRYAYVVDTGSDDLKVIEVAGAELSSAIVDSLEAGSLQVRESLLAQGQLQVTGGVNVGAGGLFSDGNVGLSGTLAIANDIAPTSSPANLVQLYAEDSAGNSELKVRDELGNVTTLSPHNFSLIGEPSEPLAWSFYAENEHGRINVDMLEAVRLLERIAGRKLVHVDAAGGSDRPPPAGLLPMLLKRLEALEAEVESLRTGCDQPASDR